jgi:small subunit ribosomal protein S18
MPTSPSPSPAGSIGGGRRRCSICKRGVHQIDFKDYPLLKEFTDYFGNIRPRRRTALCASHQRQLRVAVERARFLGMLAYRK